MKTLLSLCDRSGVWSAPYLSAGWRVVRVDKSHPPGITKVSHRLWLVGADVRYFVPSFRYDAALAAPPCCVFCRPGSRWWKQMDARGETAEGIEIFRACLRLCQAAREWWGLENPPGRHKTLIPELGPQSWQFQPFWFGDRWFKQTYIWGTARCPRIDRRRFVKYPKATRTPNGKTQGVIARKSSGAKKSREETPPGFAKAFYSANK